MDTLLFGVAAKWLPQTAKFAIAREYLEVLWLAYTRLMQLETGPVGDETKAFLTKYFFVYFTSIDHDGNERNLREKASARAKRMNLNDWQQDAFCDAGVAYSMWLTHKQKPEFIYG